MQIKKPIYNGVKTPKGSSNIDTTPKTGEP